MEYVEKYSTSADSALTQEIISPSEEYVLIQECNYEPYHTHEYPKDWEFGGAAGTDPRADLRWRGSVYDYLDCQFRIVHTTQVPLCDDEAIDKFTQVAGWGLDPIYLQVTRPDKSASTLPWQYDGKMDTVYPLGVK